MIDSARANGEVIRRAGKATMVLQIFAAVLLAMLAFVYMDISSRYATLRDGIRESAMWSVHQLDREARRLGTTVKVMVAERDLSARRLTDLAMRYDILYSRMSMLERANFERNFNVDKTVRQQLLDIQDVVYRNEPLFNAINAGTGTTIAEMRKLDREVDGLVKNTEELLIYTNTTLSIDRAETRDAVFELEKKSGLLVGMLLLSVVFLIVTLRKQLKTVRAAGLSLEAMAGTLNEAYLGAEAGNRAKSQFMATMGHEVRTPLNAILGTVELLELQPLPESAATSVKTIRSSGQALLEIINEILDYSKIEHGKLELERRIVDIRSLAESTAAIIRGRAEEHHNHIVLDLPDTLRSDHVWSDPTRLRQVILNLMSNAVKFTKEGQVTLRIRDAGTPAAPRLRVEVEDTGIGIDAAGRKKLFIPFSQVDASIGRKYGGTGLGLTICKEIITRLKGDVGVDSTPGRGSTFWFEMPVEPVSAELIKKAAEDVPAARVQAKGMNILLVEDNRVNQEVASRFLAHLGQSVTIAENGAEAVRMTEQETFDLILMDMQMPVMDGIEATLRIKERGDASSATPIVAMTANASDDDRVRCQQAGMAGFQSKPITMDALNAILLGYGKGAAEVPAEGSVTPAPVTVTPARTEPTIAPDGIDAARKAELIEALGEDIFLDLLSSFFEDANLLIDEAKSALAEGKTDDLDRALHTLKGAAVNVGLRDIAAHAHGMRHTGLSPEEITALKAEIDASRLAIAA